MPNIINADNGVVSGVAGIKTSADTSGVLNIQTNGTTAISISTAQVVSLTNSPTFTGGTANGVLYLNGSKVATSGSALTFDGTNLGVGTASPVARLDVLKTSSDTISRTNAVGAFGDYVSLGAGLLLQQTLSSPYGFALQAANAANSVQFPLLLNPSGGNVGIGTASPSTKLNVVGTVTVDGVVDVNGGQIDLDTGQPIRWGGAASSIYAGSGTNDMVFTVGSSERFRVNGSSGNLGIGTSSPAFKLSVSGVATTYAASGSLALYDTVSGVAESRNWLIGNVAAGNYGELNFAVSSAAGGAPTNSKMTLDRSGNLGLGVTPSAWSSGRTTIQINGTTQPNIQFTGNPTNGGAIWTNSFFDGVSPKYVATGAASIFATSNGSFQWQIAPSGTAGNAISFTQAMTLDASGNLGVGTTTPGTKLHVTGSNGLFVQFLNSTGNTGEGIAFGSGTNLARVSTNGASTAMAFEINATERARITSGGKMLVGTTTASGTLTVDAVDAISTGGASTYAITCGNDAADALAFGSDASFAYVQSFGNRPLILNLQGNEVRVAGTTDQGAYNLQCNGTGVWGAGAYVNGSDARLKDNIQSLDSGLDVVKAIRPVTFQYKPEYSKDQNVQPGFIAQELQAAMAGKAYLEGVVQSGPEHLNVAYQNIIPILVKAIQELSAKVTALESK